MRPETVDDEVSALVERLQETERRLEHITAGEVDTLTSRDGRTIVLQRAQHQLRQSEAIRQAGILDSLPAHIALLDAQGIIVSVNEAWQRFGKANGFAWAHDGIGTSYLDVCDRASGDDSVAAKEIATGLRAMLRREARSLTVEYACHSANEKRWFELTAAALGGDLPGGLLLMHVNITERELAKQKLEELSRETERRERILNTNLSSITDFAFTFDRDGRFLFANQPLLELFGYPLEQVVGKDFHDLGYPTDVAARLHRQIREVFDTNRSVTGESEYVSPAGVAGHYEYIFSPVAVDGIVECVVGSTRDVSARMRSADALRASEHEQRQLAVALELERTKLIAAQRVAKTGSWETDLETMAAEWSEETHRIHGTDPATFRPTYEQFLAFVHPEDRDAVDSAFRRSLTERAPCSIEHRIVLADGRIKYIEENWQVLCDIAERPVSATGTCHDVTDHRHAEAALRDSEAQFRSLAEAMPQIVWIASSVGGCTYISQQWAEYTGRTSDESIGAAWNESLHPDDRQRAREDWRQALATGATYVHEGRLRRRDGTYRWWLIRGVPVRNGGDEITQWFGTCTDVDDMKLAELEISHANDALRKSEIRVKHLNRVYSVLSGINTLIVRVSDTDELFKEACRIAVDAGGFRMAMIGLVDKANGQVVPVATSGKDNELLTAVRMRLSGPKAEESLTGQAIAQRRPMVSNDSVNDPRVVFGANYASAGVRSMVVLPLMVGDKVVGVLALYAREVDFFHDEEMKLLQGLAADVGFAVDHIEKQEQLNYLAYYDALTGLANRGLFHTRVSQFMHSAVAGGQKLALCLIDLERFKTFNDTLGRPAGDSLLQHVAGLLADNAGEAILVARLGGDQFGVVLPDLSRDGDVARHIENLLRAFQDRPFRLGDATFQVAAKFGIALFPGDGIDTDSLFNNAEAALKKAKVTGEPYLFYTQKMTETVAGRLTFENNLRQAIRLEQFVLHYQPKVNLANGAVVGAEALIRWNDPRAGLVPPAQFIPILEETGLIHEVGAWALRQAMRDFLRWRASGWRAVPIAVNVSALQLRRADFVAEIEWTTRGERDAAAGLELEITESMIMEDVAQSTVTLDAIRKLGVRIAIDDFGTGFSSLGYLAKLPIDTLKIDRSFVSEMSESEGGLALVSTIVNLAHSLKLKVVGEGVETDEQARLLRSLGCDEMQGFFFSKPVPVDVFEARFLIGPAGSG